MKVADVTHAHIATLHRDLRSTPATANRVLAVLGRLLTFAEQHAARPRGTEPIRQLKRYPEYGREGFLAADDIARVDEAWRARSAKERSWS